MYIHISGLTLLIKFESMQYDKLSNTPTTSICVTQSENTDKDLCIKHI